MLDAIHEIDYLTWILGPVESVSSRLAKVSDLEIDVEDVAQLQLRFASGALAVLSLDYVDRSYDRGCRIAGSEGSVAWSWPDGRVEAHASDGTAKRVAVPSDASATYVAEAKAFVEAASTGATLHATAAEGCHALAVVDAARRSDASGRRVTVAAPAQP